MRIGPPVGFGAGPLVEFSKSRVGQGACVRCQIFNILFDGFSF